MQYLDVDVEASREGKFSCNALHGNGDPLVYVDCRHFDVYKEKEILDAVTTM